MVQQPQRTRKRKKSKPVKQKNEPNSTLDSEFKSKLAEFDSDSAELLPKLEKLIITKTKKIRQLKTKLRKQQITSQRSIRTNTPNSKLKAQELIASNNEIKIELRVLSKELEQFNQQLGRLKKKSAKGTFLLDTYDIIDNYYMSKESSSSSASLLFDPSNNVNSHSGRNSPLMTPSESTELLKGSLRQQELDALKQDLYEANYFIKINQKSCFFKFLKDYSIAQKKSKLSEYNAIVNSESTSSISFGHEQVKFCDECITVELVPNYDEGSIQCPECGIVERTTLDPSKYSAIERQHEIQKEDNYQRTTHLNDKIDAHQGKQKKAMTPKEILKIVKELKRRHIPRRTINRACLRTILSEISMADYYCNINYLIKFITKKKTMELSPQTRHIVIDMFLRAEEIFELLLRQTRINMINYDFVLYKILHLLGEDHALRFISLPKEDKRIDELDMNWEIICREAKWEYWPTSA